MSSDDMKIAPCAYPSPTAGTIDAPCAEPLSPWMRAQLERIARDVDAAREELRVILERQP